MALRVISGLKDVGPPSRADALMASELSMIQQELPAVASEVARLYRCVLFEVRDPG